MNVELTADVTRFVESLVDSGEYLSAEDAVSEGVRLLMLRKQLKDDIQQGVAELDSGAWIDAREVFAELRDRSR